MKEKKQRIKHTKTKKKKKKVISGYYFDGKRSRTLYEKQR